MGSASLNIACFASPHGFGHAARISAVISALQLQLPNLHARIYTLTPSWFFGSAINGSHTWSELMTDIGLVQASPLEENPEATIERLSGFLPLDGVQLEPVIRQLEQENCRLVLCDISPMGIVVAEKLGVPSILVENFTWDWIYEGYADYNHGFEPYIHYLREVYARATWRIRAEPYCGSFRADLTTGPVSRPPRTPREKIRRKLGIPDSRRLVLITMGGIPASYRFLDDLQPFADCSFLVPGDNPELEVRDNMILLPYRSDLYHPDLVQASDVVISKVGYSTTAEVFHAGIPFGYFTRSGFRESDVLADFIKRRMPGTQMPESTYLDGSWVEKLHDLLEMDKVVRQEENGAEQIAAYIAGLLKHSEAD